LRTSEAAWFIVRITPATLSSSALTLTDRASIWTIEGQITTVFRRAELPGPAPSIAILDKLQRGEYDAGT